jgi:hypothetical protein
MHTVMHTCAQLRMRVMGGGVKVNPNTEIENEEKNEKLTLKSNFSAWFNISFDCHCELCKQSWVQSSVTVESLGWKMKQG